MTTEQADEPEIKIEQEELEIKIDTNDLDDEQFISIWNVAAATMNGDAPQARLLASKFLGFLCKERFAYVIVSPSDAKYLDEWYERDNSLLNDWKPESDKVDVVAQHALVPHQVFMRLLTDRKFSIDKKYSPTRATRVDWFTNDWNVG